MTALERGTFLDETDILHIDDLNERVNFIRTGNHTSGFPYDTKTG
jgi:hypothetical protein